MFRIAPTYRIHKGNEPKDSLGCTLVGESHGPEPDWVAQSAIAFDRLMEVLQAAEARGEEITAEYHDLPIKENVS